MANLPGPPVSRATLALDTSAAIFLDHLGYIERLRHLADIVLAPAVVDELRAAPDKPGSKVPDVPWIEVRAPAPRDQEEVRRDLEAHAGELETLALALGGTVVPVIDERPARRYATERGLRMTSTLALLLGLHRRGMAARTVEEDLALLTAAGMYLTEDLIAWTVEQAQVPGPSGSGDRDLLGR